MGDKKDAKNNREGISRDSADAEAFFSDNGAVQYNKVENTLEKYSEEVSTVSMDNQNSENDRDGKSKRKLPFAKILGISLAVLVLVVGAIYGGGAYYYTSHFLRGTVINGIDVSNMTYSELTDTLEEYNIKITERGKNDNEEYVENISGADIEVSLLSDSGVREILEQQSVFLWFEKSGKTYEKDQLISYNEDKLTEKILSLRGFNKSYADKPVSAHISEFDQVKGYSIVNEKQGNFLKKKPTLAAVKEAVNKLSDEIDLSQMDECYMKPKVDSGNQKLNNLLTNLNKMVKVKISYYFGTNEEVVDGSTINQWLQISDDYKVTLDKEKVGDYVESLRKKYDTIFTTRIFKTHYGDKVTISNGDYGWWMNVSQETEELAGQIEDGKSGERTPVYYQTAAQYGTKDWGKSYVEINLTAQHLWVYVKGKVKLETDVCTGNTSLKRGTNEGIFGITYKERYGVLVGETYVSTVAYWMPFDGDIGLHDAIWKTRFGSDYYKTEGSHGCVNLPYDTAKKIYDLVEKGTPVIVYKLKGTESDSTTTQDYEEISHAATEAIDAIGTVTKDSGDDIETARYMYDKVGSAGQKYVENYDVLLEAEKNYKQLTK